MGNAARIFRINTEISMAEKQLVIPVFRLNSTISEFIPQINGKNRFCEFCVMS